MEYRKNDMVTLDIVDCGTNGEGIGKADGFTVFVKDAVIGDRVTAKIMKAKKNYGYGKTMEILTPSPATVRSRYVLLPVSAADASFRRFPMKNSWNLKLTRFAGIWTDWRLCQSAHGTHYRYEGPVPLPQQSTVSGRTEQGWKNRNRILCRTHPQHYRKQGLCPWRSAEQRDSGPCN